MNKNIESLVKISQEPKRNIIGLMSGTSLDGLDIALCEVEGSGLDTKLSVRKFTTMPYDEDLKNEIRKVFSKENIELQQLCLLNEWVGSKHAGMINDCLTKWNINKTEVDLIASHGQTIYHAPKKYHRQEKFGNATLQIGDGDHIAVATGIVTISDFRQKHIAAGAEGAPLAVYGDYLLFSKQDEDRILLNIGGIANFTWLPGNRNITEMISTDVGPGNTMMDAYMQQTYPGKYFDEDAAVATKGSVNGKLLQALKEHDFFAAAFPKTTGPELFNLNYLDNAKQRSGTSTISAEDTMHTLNKFSADMIVEAIRNISQNKKALNIFTSGGGSHNPLLIRHLKDQLSNCYFDTTASLGIDPDAKEAVLFALLANECICGDPSLFGKTGPGMPAITMGKISFPL